MLAVAVMLVSGGSVYAMADDPAITNPVGPLDGPGKGVEGAHTRTGGEAIAESQKDYDYYVKEINKRICEMKLESCPIDQILRSASRTNHSKSMVVKFYQIGQRPIKSTLSEAVEATTDGAAHTIKPVNNSAFDSMDTILFPDVMGYKEDGVTRETLCTVNGSCGCTGRIAESYSDSNQRKVEQCTRQQMGFARNTGRCEDAQTWPCGRRDRCRDSIILSAAGTIRAVLPAFYHAGRGEYHRAYVDKGC